jgi:hypothetical protein
VQASVREIRADDPGEGQIRLGKVGAGEVGTDQLDAMQLGP